MSEPTISKYYSDDHDQLDGYFKKFKELKRKNYHEAKEYFKKFKFGLQRHILWEEEILFPVFEEKTGMVDAGPTFVMRQEHRQIEQAMEAVHKKVQRQDPDSDLEERQLENVLGEHNFKEENILYPSIDDQTSDQERAGIFKKMQSMPEGKYRTCCNGHSR